MTELLNKILAERPENVIDFFEEYSRKVKEQRFKPLTDHLEDIYVQPGRFALSNKLLPLLNVSCHHLLIHQLWHKNAFLVIENLQIIKMVLLKLR